MGHDHPARAASPAALRGEGTPARPAPLWRSLALGFLVGAAVGALQAAEHLQGEGAASVARRAAWLVLRAGVLWGVAGALATLVLTPLSRLSGVRYARSFQRVLAGLACLGLGAAALFAARSVGAALDELAGEAARAGPGVEGEGELEVPRALDYVTGGAGGH